MSNDPSDVGSPDDLSNDYLTWELEDSPCATERFPWGKHKGRRFCDIPMTYLLWALSQDFMWEDTNTVAGRRRKSLRTTLLHFLWSQPSCGWIYEATKKALNKLEPLAHKDNEDFHDYDPSAKF